MPSYPPPTAQPSWAPGVSFFANSSCEFKQPESGDDVCTLPSVSFDNLVNRGISRWYLAITVARTNWGNTPSSSLRDSYVLIDALGLNDTSQGFPFPKKCAPVDSSSCPGQPFACLTNQQIFLVSDMSSVTFSAKARNFHSTSCKEDGRFDIVLSYTLTGTNPQPTGAPTLFPTKTLSPSAAPAASGVFVFENGQSAEALMGENAPLYVVAGFALLFVAVGVFVLQSRDQGVGARDSIFDTGPAGLRSSSKASVVQALEQSFERKGGRVVSLKLYAVLLDFGLTGSAFVSECFFIALLWSSSQFRHLAGVVFVGRIIHLTAGSAMIYLLTNPSASLPRPFQPRQPLRQLINLKNFKENIKLCGVLCLLGALDVTLFRYLPWLHSQFSAETKGYPSPFVFGLCIASKLLQSLFIISCQIVFLAGSSRDASFLAVNVSVTVLVFLVNAVEAVLWSGFMQEWQTAGARAGQGEEGDASPGSARSVEMLDSTGRGSVSVSVSASATSNPIVALASSTAGLRRDSIPAPSLPRTSLAMPLQGYDLECEERGAAE